MFLFLDCKIFLHNTGKALTGISCVQYVKAFPSTVYKKRIDLKKAEYGSSTHALL